MIFVLALCYVVSAPAVEPAATDPYEAALELYDQGRFAEAAARFEAMADANGPPVRRFEAGQMRLAAGHMAHAARNFEAYLAGELDAEERALAQSRLDKAVAGTRTVEVRVTPGERAVTVVARWSGAASGQRPGLATPVTGGVATLRLDPGDWELGIDAPGFVRLRRTITVGDGSAPVALWLVPVAVAPTSKPGPVPVPPDRRAGRGQTVAGLVLLPLGLATLGGFIATAVIHAGTRREYRGVDYDCEDLAVLADLQGRARRETGAMVGLGVASGALLGAGTTLLVRGQRAQRRARLGLDVRPGRAGLLLSGEF